MPLKPIKTAKDYKEAMKRVEALWDAKIDTPEGDELDILTTLICAYEDTHFPISPPTPVEAIKFRMEQEGLEPSDLVPYLGQRSRVTEVLNYQRKLSLAMIRKLSDGLHIPLDSLVKDYPISRKNTIRD